MENLLTIYLSVGFGVWLALAVARAPTFYNASILEVTKGLLFASLGWPVALVVMSKICEDERQEAKDKNVGCLRGAF